MVEQGFNQTDWNDAWERRMAADDVAQMVFQPMYRRVETAEAAAKYKLSDAFIGKLEEDLKRIGQGDTTGRWSSG